MSGCVENPADNFSLPLPNDMVRGRIASRVSSAGASLANSNAFTNLSKQEATRILAQGHHCFQQSHMQRVATALGSSGANLLYPHYTASPLSSASLLASYIKHRILRNLESPTPTVIRRTLDLVSEKHPVWTHHSPQTARRIQFEQLARHLEGQERILALHLRFDEDQADALEAIRAQLAKVRLLLERCMEDGMIRGSLHPTSIQQDERIFLTPTEAAQLPSPSATVRGILVRLRGPRRGNRAMTWQKSAGRISTNSVKYVVAEEAKVQIPSKLGVYGLTVRIVYARHNRLIDCLQPLPIADRPAGYTILQNFIQN